MGRHVAEFTRSSGYVLDGVSQSAGPGPFNWTVPTGVFDVQYEGSAPGGGGGGGFQGVTAGGGGGGGGAGKQIKRQAGAVTPGTSVSITLGAPGAGGAPGVAGGNAGLLYVTRLGVFYDYSSGGGAGTASAGGLGGGTQFVWTGGAGGTSGNGAPGNAATAQINYTIVGEYGCGAGGGGGISGGASGGSAQIQNSGGITNYGGGGSGNYGGGGAGGLSPLFVQGTMREKGYGGVYGVATPVASAAVDGYGAGGNGSAGHPTTAFAGSAGVEGVFRIFWDDPVPGNSAADTTLLSRITGTVMLAGSYSAPDNAGVASIKAKTDNLPAAPASEGNVTAVGAAVSALPTTAAIASAVWSATTRTLSAAAFTVADIWTYVTRTLTSASGPTTAQIAVAVVDQALSGHATAGTVGGALQSASASGDPLAQLVPGSYAAGTGGYALGKLNVPTPTTPVVVIPGSPVDASLCRLYGYFENINSAIDSTLTVQITLIAPGVAASERLITGRSITASIDSQGRLSYLGQPYVDLQRNDLLTPAGSTYQVTCAALNASYKSITLSGALADLRALLLA